jgi:acyl-CoA oxidase
MPLLASTYALSFGLDYVKDFFAKHTTTGTPASTVDAKMLVILCCALKPMVTWHANETANICRERCGGQGYLSCNKFGHAIGGAHAGNVLFVVVVHL